MVPIAVLNLLCLITGGTNPVMGEKMTKIKSAVSKVMTNIFLNKALKNEEYEPLDEVVPRIYLGGVEQAMNPRLLSFYRISHIVNVSQTENVFENGLEMAVKQIAGDWQIQNIANDFIIPKYHRISIPDKSEVDLTNYFLDAFEFIQKAHSQETNRILIHCHAGVSRSSTIMIGYLIYSANMLLDDAYRLVRIARPRINPNRGFRKQLLGYHVSNFGDSRGTDEFVRAHAL